MVEKKLPQVSIQITLARQILTRLGDFSAMKDEDNLVDNIHELAETFVAVGDLEEFPHELSQLFTNCLSQLSVQIPIYANVISLIHMKNREFSSLVVKDIADAFVANLKSVNVLKMKLLLRSVACLASCGVFKTAGDGSLVELLEVLLIFASTPTSGDSNRSSSSFDRSAALYLLTNTMLWSPFDLLSKEFLQKMSVFLRQYLSTRWKGAFSSEGCFSILHYEVHYPNGITAELSDHYPSSDPSQFVGDTIMEEPGFLADGLSCFRLCSKDPLTNGVINVSTASIPYDTLSESCIAAFLAVHSYMSTASWKRPECMLQPWTSPHIGGSDPTDANTTVVEMTSLVVEEDEKMTASGDITTPETLCFHPEFSNQVREYLSKNGFSSTVSEEDPSSAKIPLCPPVGFSAVSSWLRPRFVIFDSEISSQAAACCQLSFSEKQMAWGYYQDVLHFFDPLIHEDGTRSGSLDLLIDQLLAVSKLFPPLAQLEYLLIEMLFQTMLQQPVNSSLNVSIFRLVLELCKKSPVFPPAVALSANIVFQMLPELDFASWREFGRWFSFHIINSKLSWPYWSFWVAEFVDAETSEIPSSTVSFCKYVVEHCSTAVIPEQLKANFPETFHKYIASSSSLIKPGLIFESEPVAEPFESTESVVVQLFRPHVATLKEILAKRSSPDDVESWFDSVSVPSDEKDHDSWSKGDNWKGYILLQTILTVSDGALSKIQGLLDRYGGVFRAVAPSDENQMVLIDALHEMIGHAEGPLTFVLDELLRRSLISASNSVKWILRKDKLARLLCSELSVWSHLEYAIDRSVDFVKAAVIQRRDLGGMMVMDETADLSPSDPPLIDHPGQTINKLSTNDDTGMDVIASEEDGKVEMEEENEGISDDRRRSRGNRESFQNESITIDDDDNQEDSSSPVVRTFKIIQSPAMKGSPTVDPIWESTEAVKSSLKEARTISRLLVTEVLNGLTSLELEQEGGHQYARVAYRSLLNRLLRTFIGAEQGLSRHVNQRIDLIEYNLLKSSLSDSNAICLFSVLDSMKYN